MTRVSRAHAAIALLAFASGAAACASHRPSASQGASAVSPIRGNEEAADSVSELDRAAVYRTLLRTFYRPTSGQARWIDTRPLGEKRGAADTTLRAMADDEMPPDAAWAESVAEAGGLNRICVLGGAEDDCKGRPGGIVRFSPPYADGPGRVHVYASYTPHGGAVGPSTELRFTLRRHSDGWRIVDKTSVSHHGDDP